MWVSHPALDSALNEITEGSTVFLNVTQPGALLYIGDPHAAMGDGETTEWALETSMDVEFSVEIIKSRYIASPRVETVTQYAAIGIAGSAEYRISRNRRNRSAHSTLCDQGLI